MLLQAILLGLVAMLGNAEYLFGTSLLSRPLVMGTLTGIVLGDIQTGVTLGATLELAFMGAFSIGASIPPEMISGTVLGTAFTITTCHSYMDFKWFTNHNGLITCNWVRFIINDDYGKRRCMFLLLRICIKRILKDSSNSNRNLWSYHCYRINSVT